MNHSDEKKLRKLYIDLCDASIKKDLDLLNSILANNYVLVHMTGRKQTKHEYMNSVKTGELTYFEAIHESIEIKIKDNIATIIGKTKTLASPFGSSKSWWKLKQNLIAEKQDGKWVLTHAEASTY